MPCMQRKGKEIDPHNAHKHISKPNDQIHVFYLAFGYCIRRNIVIASVGDFHHID